MSVRISPEAALLPANVLRFYLHFDRPAEARFERAGLILVAADGEAVREPFLTLSQELWSPDGRRLTVLMEPGRIKRGIGTGPTHDPAFEPGRRYRLELTIDGETARHAFRIGEVETTPLDPARWRSVAPGVGTLEAATLDFGRVVDAASVADEVTLVRPDGSACPADRSLDRSGSFMLLRPRAPWRDEDHAIVFSARFEDVCGNRIGEALDHHLSAPGQPAGASSWFRPRTR